MKMKKIFTLTLMMLCMVLSANAQARKTWDFTQGLSEQTKADIIADATNWTQNRTDADGNPSGWKNAVQMTGILKANGKAIPELDGLYFHEQTSKAYTAGRILLDPSSIRVGGKGGGFKFKLIGGQKITIKARSANKTATDRGFVGDDNLEYIEGPANGTCLGGDVEGSEGTYTLVWQVKETVTDSTDVIVYASPNGGLDLELIMIDEGDMPEVAESKTVAYVADAEKIEMDLAWMMMESTPGYVFTHIPATATDVTLDSLLSYDAVMIAPSVTAEHAMTAVLKSAIAFQPIVNLNADIYAAWSLGEVVATEQTGAEVAERHQTIDLFTTPSPMDVTTGIALSGELMSGVKLAGVFAADSVWATLGEGVAAIHQHTNSRNSFLGITFNETTMSVPDEGTFVALLGNALELVSATKKDIVATTAPTYKVSNGNGFTTVEIKVPNKNAIIYYTTDGTEPTEASNVYSEPLIFNEATTIKAMSTLEGYLQSKTTECAVEIAFMAATPTISLNKEATQTTITLSCASEGADIYYSYNGISKAAEAQKYTEPIVLTEEPTEIFAFAVGGQFVQSDMASEYVSINSINANTIRIDTLAHFDANQTDWYPETPAEGGTGEAKAHYYWGKNAWEYYSTEVEREEIVKGSEGQDSVVYIYKPNAEAIKVITPNTENGWILRSQGQVLTGELTSAATNIVGNGATGYYAQTAEDMIGGGPTKGKITFGGKVSGNPYTASIETTGKYAAPFDVVVYCTNGTSKNDQIMEVQVSEDGATWTKIGQLKMAPNQRYFTKTRIAYNEDGKQVYVRLAQTGGSTKAQVYDIYILNNGEYSKKYDAGTVGIEDIQNNGETVSEEVFNINGVRLNGTRSGLNIIRKQYSDGTFKTVKVVR